MPEKSFNRLLDRMPEAFVSDVTTTREVSRAVKAGKLRRLGTRLYSRNLSDPPAHTWKTCASPEAGDIWPDVSAGLKSSKGSRA